MKRVVLNLVLVFLFVSCSLDDGDNNANNLNLETLSIKEAVVPTEFTFGGTHNIKVIYDLPSGCHSFYDLFYRHEGTSRTVAVNALVDESLPCTESLVEAEHTFQVNIVQREDYVFKFWKGTDENGENIFEEITVPVNE